MEYWATMPFSCKNLAQPPLPKRLYKSCICRGGSQATPTNLFVGVALITSRPYKPICRGGCSTNRPYKSICRGDCSTSRSYKYLFVGAVQSRTVPTVRFSAKKIQIYNSNSTRTLFVSVYSIQRSRCQTPRDQRATRNRPWHGTHET